MKVTLLTADSSIKYMQYFAALAALTCHANANNDFVPSDVLKRIIKAGHESILEHINLTYSVKGLSRACLQELARHRHISLSVESTRHTLQKQVNDETWVVKYLNSLDENQNKIAQMFLGCAWSNPEMSNDELKYFLPEFWPTNLIMTVNVRELRHILDLRTASAALMEFRDLAHALYDAVPEEYRYLLADCVHEEVSYSGKPNNCSEIPNSSTTWEAGK